MKSLSWGGAQTKGEVHKRELTLLHSDLLISLSSSLTPLFFTIKKLAMRTNEIKRYSAINQSYCIICTFDLRQTLPKYLRICLHGNAVLMICLTDQSGYSICLLYGQTFHPYSSSYSLECGKKILHLVKIKFRRGNFYHIILLPKKKF